jgi:hypothetical protein
LKIYAFALAIFIFCSFSAVIQEMGVFGNIYSHENTFETNVNETDIGKLEQISGDNLLSSSELSDSNSDIGGISVLIKSLGAIVNIIKKALFIDVLIMEYVPPSATTIVQPFANFARNIMLLIYGVGLISWYRKYRVG